MSGKMPRWEADIWDYMSRGDGEHCPLINYCEVRRRRGWCLDDNGEHLKRQLDYKRFNPGSYEFVEGVACGEKFRTMEMLAYKYLKRGGACLPPVPVELVSLFDEQNRIDVRVLPMKACHGAIWRLEEGWVIQLNEGDPPTARRFILFHEAFHILAHCKTNPVFRKRGVIQGSFNEFLADAFAAFILMPGGWVRKKWAETHDVEQLAKIFDVPKLSLCIRLKFLGLSQ